MLEHDTKCSSSALVLDFYNSIMLAEQYHTVQLCYVNCSIAFQQQLWSAGQSISNELVDFVKLTVQSRNSIEIACTVPANPESQA